MYRPTVRYDDSFKDYVDSLFQSTNLDRNQIIRLALFTLGHSEEGKQILKSHLKQNTSLPSPNWSIADPRFYMESTVKNKVEGGTSPMKSGGTSPIKNEDLREGRQDAKPTTQKREGTIHNYSSTNNGGIKLFIK